MGEQKDLHMKWVHILIHCTKCSAQHDRIHAELDDAVYILTVDHLKTNCAVKYFFCLIYCVMCFSISMPFLNFPQMLCFTLCDNDISDTDYSLIS